MPDVTTDAYHGNDPAKTGREVPRVGENRVRRFLTWCGIATIGMSLLTWFGLGGMLRNELLDTSRRDAIYLATALRDLEVNNMIQPADGGGYVLRFDEARQPQINKRMRVVMSQFAVDKIKIFDSSRTVIYSTDLRIIGKQNLVNAGLTRGLDGQITCRFASPKQAWDMPGEAALNVDVVETFLPIFSEDGAVIGCLVIYRDVLKQTQEVRSLRFRATVLISALLVLVFTFLTIFMHRADRTISLQQLELTDSERRLRTIVENIADGIIVYDEQCTVHSLNVAAQRMFGYTSDQLTSLGIGDLFVAASGNDRGLPSFVGESSESSTATGFELRGVRSDGSTFPARFISRRTTHPKDTIYVAMVSDLSEQKRLEFITRENDLRRTTEMNTIAQLATGVAHEVRNPLTSMLLLVQSQIEQAPHGSDLAEDLKVIEGEIRRMEHSLGTFLEFARPGKPHRTQVEAGELLNKICTLVEGRAHKQHVTIAYDPVDGVLPAFIHADPDQIIQVFLNLILNALDVLPHGGSIHISLTVKQDNMLEVSIKDTGPGLAPHVLDSLFEPFITTKSTGMGLGLAVSKRIIELHHGELTGFNSPDGGACFVVDIPLADTGTA